MGTVSTPQGLVLEVLMVQPRPVLADANAFDGYEPGEFYLDMSITTPVQVRPHVWAAWNRYIGIRCAVTRPWLSAVSGMSSAARCKWESSAARC